MKKKLIIVIALLAIIGYFGYNYVMAPPKDIATAKVDFNKAATEIAEEFSKDEKIATTKYQEKVITVKGIITGVEDKSITLDNKVTCGFENKTKLNKGDAVKIKGLFIGFDEMFEEVKLDKCSIVK